MADFLVGDIVDVNGQLATIRFLGETEFQTGDWIGVELDSPTGKNNGTVQGVRYFSCKDKYGMFIRPAIPRLVERPEKKPVPLRRKSSVVSPGLKGPQANLRSPTKGVGSATPSTGPSTPRTTTPAGRTATGVRSAAGRTTSMGPPARPGATTQPGAVKRQSISNAPPSRTQSTSSTSSARAGAAAASRTPTGRPSAGSALGRKVTPEATGDVGAAMRRSRSDTAGDLKPGTTPRGSARSPGVGTTGTSPRPRGGTMAGSSDHAALKEAQRKNEDLESKIKILEKKRGEDRENLKTLERVQGERDKFESIIHTLRQKYQPQQQELVDLKKHVKEMEATMEELEAEKAENDTILELATLDKEMAEEQTEAYKAELDAVRGKAEELEAEMELLKEENAELSQGMSPEEKTSAGWMQLEKQNERLKEALLRLRDMTQQTEQDLRETIKDLEEELSSLAKMKEEFEDMREQYLVSESVVEDLRQQLDAALGAEEMLEELTDRNMNMSEQIDELRATIEDLESLKEISDELEINHIETEKAMQEDLDYKDLIISEQARKMSQLDQSNEEAEYTITRFRDLVSNLQSDLEDMRASQQITETEANELTARSRSMMDINLKLQISASKAQNKTIDLELRRMEAEEALEHLDIVQMFLPDAFQSDRDSVHAFLRFKRVAFKANLLQTFVKERINSGQLQTGHEDTHMAACEMVDKLTWVSAMCDRFVNCIASSNVQQFSRFQGALYELDPVERALNNWIENLRKGDLKEKQCAEELQRTMALMSHLGEIHLRPDLEGFASDVHMKMLLMQSHMESVAAAMAHVRLMVQSKLDTTSDEEEISTAFAKKTDFVISGSRSAKVVISKVLRAIDDFRQRSFSLTPDHGQTFDACEEVTSRLAKYSRAIGDDVYALLYADDDQGETSAGWQQLQSTLFRTTEHVLSMSESDMFGTFSKELKSLSTLLSELGTTAGDIDMTTEFEKPAAPWITRAQELKKTKVVNIDVEEEVRRLKDDILERMQQIKIRDKQLEETAVKIELLESRMRTVTKQSERIEELEKGVSEGTAREKDLADTIGELNEEVQTLETEIASLRKKAEDKKAVGEHDRASADRAVASQREVNRLQNDINFLTKSIQYFRAENKALRKADVQAVDSWLRHPLLPTEAERAQREHEQNLRAESSDVLAELMALATDSRVTDLKALPKDRMKWRPVKETARYKVLAMRERYESVVAWKEDVCKRAEVQEVVRKRRKPRFEGVGLESARLDLPWKGKGWVGPREVVVRDAEGWEEVGKALGIEVEV